MKELQITSIGFIFLLLAFKTEAQLQKKNIDILPAEQWWCGIISRGSEMPLNNSSSFFFDMQFNDCSQVQPLLMSNKGRVIWNDNPFTVQFINQQIVLNGVGEFIVNQAGATLKEAQQFAQKKYFPSSGNMPDTLLFSRPQYNTWIELNYHQNQTDILKYAHAIINNGLSPGVLMIDANWQENYGMWKFKPAAFPNPKAMVDELHQLGFKVMLWVVPFISPDCTAFLPLLDKENILIMDSANPKHPLFIKWWEGYSAEIDFTNPNGMKWFVKQLTDLQKTYGIDGFKLDAGDFERFPSNGLTYKKVSGNEHNSIYAAIGLQFPFNEYRASWKMGGQALGQRLCDKEHTWKDLRKLIPEMMILSLSGYSYACPDMIGGGEISSFLNNSLLIDQDLIVRSAQCQALMPMMQFSVAPWRILDSLHMNAIRESVKTRNKFSSLIVQLAKKSAQAGEPVVKPLEYAFPNQGFAKTVNQFMLGDSILVTPMLEKNSNKLSVRLPMIKGAKWIADDGKIYKAGTTVLIDVPLNRLPYFILR